MANLHLDVDTTADTAQISALATKVELLAQQLRQLDGKRVKVKVDLDAPPPARIAAIRALSTALDDLDGRRVRASVEITGIPGAPEVRALRAAAKALRELDGANATARVDITGMAGLDPVALRRAARALRELEQVGAINIHINITGAVEALAQVAALRTELRGLPRNTEVDVNVNVQGAGAAALAAGRILGIAAAALYAVPAVGSLSASVATLGGSLVSLAGLAPLAVGGLAAAGAAAAALGVGLAHVGDALGETDTPAKLKKVNEAIAALSPSARAAVLEVRGLGPVWSTLRLDVQERLFKGLSGEVAGLANTYLPVLKTGLGGISTEFNGLALDAVEFAKSSQTIADTGTIFENTRLAMVAARPAATNLLTAFRDIAVVGTAELPALAEGWTQATGRFRTFIAEARESGQLREWIQGGIDTLAQFGRVAGNVGGIAGSIFTAARSSGADFLSTVERVTGGVEDFLKSAEGQNSLVAFFVESREAIDAVLPGLETLGRAGAQAVAAFSDTGGLSSAGEAFSRIAAVVAPLLPMLGKLAGETLGMLATSAAAVGSALSPIVSVITGIVSALGPFGPMIATVLITMKAFAIAAGVIATVFPAIATAVGVLVTVLTGFSVVGAAAAASVTAFLTAATATPVLLALAAVVFVVSQAIQSATGDMEGWAAGMAAGGDAAAKARVEFEKHNAQFREGSILAGLFGKSEADLAIEIGKVEAAMTPLELATSRVATAQLNYDEAVRLFTANSPQAIDAQRLLAVATDEQEAAQGDAAAATKDHTDRMVEQQQAVQASLSSGIAYEQSLRGIERAQDAAAEATREHGAGSLEAREAIGRLEESVLSAAAAAGRKAAADSGATNEAEKNRIATEASTLELLKWASGADGPAKDAALRMLTRLSDTELQTLQNTGAMNGFSLEILKTPDGKAVTVTTPGLEAAREGIKTLTTQILNIQGKTVTIMVSAKGEMGGIASAGRLATGGILPGYTPGQDPHRFVSATGGRLDLSGGEAVMRPEWTRAVSPSYVHAANRAARSGGVGGVRAFLARTAPRPGEGRGGDGNAFATGGVIGQARQSFAPGGIVANVGYQRDMSGFNRAMAAMETKAVELGTAASGGNVLAWARTQAGKPYGWGAVGPGAYDCSGFMSALVNVMRGRNPHSRLGATGNFPWAGFRPGIGPGLSIGSFRGDPGHMAGTIGGTNVESSGGVGVRVGGGARGAGHGMFTTRAHIFDRGGILEPGGVGLNLSGRRERVLDPDSTIRYDRQIADAQALRRGAGMAAGGGPTFGAVVGELGQLRRDMGAAIRGDLADAVRSARPITVQDMSGNPVETARATAWALHLA